MQCLCHPSLSTTFFSFATIALVAKWASRARGVETIICDVPAFVPVDIFFVAPALVAAHDFCFLNPSNEILLVLFEMTLCVMFGGLDFRTRQIWRVYFARGVQKTKTDFLKFKFQLNSLHKCIHVLTSRYFIRGVHKLRIGVPTFAAVHIFLTSPPCVGMRFACLATPLRRACAVRAFWPALSWWPQSRLMTPLMSYSWFCHWCH